MNANSTRQEAIQLAQAYLSKKPIYLDTETTGVRSNAEIIEISIIDHDGNVLLDSFVKPQGMISADAERIHGISNEVVSSAPEWPDVWPLVQEAADGQAIGIFNSSFDLRLMEQSHYAAGLLWSPLVAEPFCIMHLYAQFYGEWDRHRRSYRWQSLEKAGRQCKIALPNSHRAKDDTLLTRAILQYMAEYPV